MIWRASTCCSSVRRERLPAGSVQHRMVDDTEVRHSGARSHRLRVVVGADRPRRALCDSCQDTPRVVVLCFLGPTPDHKSTGRAISWRQRRAGCSRSRSGRTARRAEPRNTRPTTTPSSCGATTVAGPREARFMVLTIQSCPIVSKCVFIA